MQPSDLHHVFWLGGATCAGKTSIADRLAKLLGWQVYHYDRHEPDHVARRLQKGDQQIAAFLALSMDERWLLRPPEVMAEETIASWMIRFQLVLEDLRAMQAVPPIVAEGAGLFPECVAPWLSRPHQALWLIPTRAFIAQVRHGRIHGAPYQTSDPARALANIIARDELIAQHHQRAAQERGLATYSIDGTRSLDDVTTSVAGYYTHFG